jgi:HD-GYP domain-containing protein (c-di-GMP phosphodiesterase class II)
MTEPLRLGELVATLALAQDNAFGQPLESQFRSCILASWLARAASLDAQLHEVVYWVALLRYVGCTGHAHEVSALFGDEIALRARTLVHDSANGEEVVADLFDFAGSDSPDRLAMVQSALAAHGPQLLVPNFAAGCEVADLLVRRLDLPAEVSAALACTFERWNGHGFPNFAAGEAIPVAMRIVHLTHDVEAIARLRSKPAALAAVSDRRDRTYDPALVDIFAPVGAAWLDELDTLDPWSTVLALEPEPHRLLTGVHLDEALTVAADFVDLKSPFMASHSRRCADLAGLAATGIGLDADSVTMIRRAALVHDLGTTSIPNSILDKPGPLTSAERDRVRHHSMLTEQMLRRTPALAALSAVAAAHHERCDGSGYHKGVRLGGDPAACILAAVDVYVALTTDRADRRALSPTEAAQRLRELVHGGELTGGAVDAVLGASGHEISGRRRRGVHPAGLSDREIEVLRLMAQGLSTKAIAEQLFISAKTADHHIQHVYTKIGVQSRGAAALWAMQHSVLS